MNLVLITAGIVMMGILLLDGNVSHSKSLLDEAEMDAIDAKGESPALAAPTPEPTPAMSDAELEELVGSGQTFLSPYDQPFHSIAPLPLVDYFNPNGTQYDPTPPTPQSANPR